ncbi:CobW family GTP-binding protein [Alkalihalobacillus sp. CinArs1]|uniref:CobW family GTP-binding protein n=1 Tax=Alkalihalobacillus sp. CinArs1 TaxID=2995314 RepID=UPI0022DDF077|nr:GTP-binding protein [Alkalihalobacillus sp. CinArs1]
MTLPVYMISGFLGSGKTTTLLHMIKESKRRGLKTGIILNELGEKNVEADYFEGQHIKQLLNGCICCSIQDDLKETLRSFKDEDIDLLLIEGTGVANPRDIEDALLSLEFIECFDLYSMISVVDGSSFLEFQNIFSSNKEVRKLLHEQISCATMVILNKVDLTKPGVLSKVEKKINGMLKQDVPVFQTSFGEIDSEELFEKRYMRSNLNSRQTDPHRHNHSTIRSIKIEDVPTLNRIQLNKWVENLPKEVLRGKGIVEFKETPGQFLIQFSSGKLRFERIKSREESNVIILIGDGLNVEQLNTSLQELATGS